jgi:hypothetical protein
VLKDDSLVSCTCNTSGINKLSLTKR